MKISKISPFIFKANKNKYLLFLLVFIVCLVISCIFLNDSKPVYAQDLGSDIESTVTLDWETLNSYTPPFYEGKPLAGESGDVKVVANVSIQTPAGTFDPSKLYYSWFINDQRSHTYSGTGSNVLFMELDPLVTGNTVELQVYTSGRLEQLLADKTITIYPRDVKAIMYQDLDNPILTYANAINKHFQEYTLPKSALKIIAEPFYFSVDNSTDPKLTYTWSVNGIPGNIGNSGPNFQYNIPDQQNSSLNLGLKIDNSDQVLQSSEEKVNFTPPTN